MVTSYWDTCASHNFISTRLAAEVIANGSPWKKCELPIRQGVLNAGVSRVKLLINLTIMHRGRELILRNEEVFVWDMGNDLTLCNALLEQESLLPTSPNDSDDTLLSLLVTKDGPFDAGQGETLLLSHLQSRANYTRSSYVSPASLNSVAQVGSDAPEFLTDSRVVEEHERAVRDFADSVARQTSQARVDEWDLPKIFEIRRLLLAQLASPDAECARRLEEIKLRYPEAFSENITSPCRLRKFEIHLKPNFKYYCFLPRRASEPVIAEMRKQILCLTEPFRKSTEPFRESRLNFLGCRCG
jgi:hypothetical protein